MSLEISSPVTDVRVKRSMITLANIAELSAQVILEVAGNDISNRLNGVTINNDIIKTMVISHLNNRINSKKVQGA